MDGFGRGVQRKEWLVFATKKMKVRGLGSFNEYSGENRCRKKSGDRSPAETAGDGGTFALACASLWTAASVSKRNPISEVRFHRTDCGDQEGFAIRGINLSEF